MNIQLNNYFRKRNLNDVNLIKSFSREIENISGMEFKYIFKNIIDDNTNLGEATYEYIYQNSFSTLARFETASYMDSLKLVNDFNFFNDETMRVTIDYENWVNNARLFLNDETYDEPPIESDLMILVNENYSFDVFQISSVYRYDYYFQFNEKIFYRLFLKKYSAGEDVITGFEPVSEVPAELAMLEEIVKLGEEYKPDNTTPQFKDFNIDDLDDLL